MCHFCITYLYFHSSLHTSTSCFPSDGTQLFHAPYSSKWDKTPHCLIQTYHYAWKTLKSLKRTAREEQALLEKPAWTKVVHTDGQGATYKEEQKHIWKQ